MQFSNFKGHATMFTLSNLAEPMGRAYLSLLTNKLARDFWVVFPNFSERKWNIKVVTCLSLCVSWLETVRRRNRRNGRNRLGQWQRNIWTEVEHFVWVNETEKKILSPSGETRPSRKRTTFLVGGKDIPETNTFLNGINSDTYYPYASTLTFQDWKIILWRTLNHYEVLNLIVLYFCKFNFLGTFLKIFPNVSKILSNIKSYLYDKIRFTHFSTSWVRVPFLSYFDFSFLGKIFGN